MNWHISRAMMAAYGNSRSSPEQVEAYSEECSSDGEPFAPLNSNPIPQAYLSKDRMTAFSRLSRFGMTFAPLTENRGEELLTWFLAGFHVKTFQPQERVQESAERDRDSGAKWPASLAKYDHDSHSWRTHQYSLLGGLTLFSETWPRWGMMRDGALYPQPTPALRISGKGSGYWPTPRKTMPDNLSCNPTINERGRLVRASGRDFGINLADAVKMWPTPQAIDGSGKGREPRLKKDCNRNPNMPGSYRADLKDAVQMWPTPRAGNPGSRPNGKGGKSRMDQLPNAVQWTTPCADDTAHRKNKYAQGGTALSTQAGGHLNPTWVEWLMNWPFYWTSLEKLDHAHFEYWKKASATQVSNNGEQCVRPMWWDADPSATPYRPKPDEQRAEECGGTLLEMPRGGTQKTGVGSLRDLREGISTEEVEAGEIMREPRMLETDGEIIGRVAVGVTARVDRLKAIGNGQCSQAMALAWRILSEGLI